MASPCEHPPCPPSTGGGVKPWLEVWTAAERAAARAQLAQHRDQIDRLDAASAAFETALEGHGSAQVAPDLRFQGVDGSAKVPSRSIV